VAKPVIPQRVPLADTCKGVILQLGDAQLLAAEPQPDASLIASGEFVVRYGLRFLGKLHVSIVPGMVVLDYGDVITGEEAWEFLLKHSNLHPRAEVIGCRNDGSDDMVVVKNLDMAVQPEVLIYPDEAATRPIAHPAALIAPELTVFPARLLEYLPHYLTLKEWLAVQHDR
jgi:hypothetical protein